MQTELTHVERTLLEAFLNAVKGAQQPDGEVSLEEVLVEATAELSQHVSEAIDYCASYDEETKDLTADEVDEKCRVAIDNALDGLVKKLTAIVDPDGLHIISREEIEKLIPGVYITPSV